MHTWDCLKMSCTPKNPSVLLIIIPFLNGDFIGGIPHFHALFLANDRSGGIDDWCVPTGKKVI